MSEQNSGDSGLRKDIRGVADRIQDLSQDLETALNSIEEKQRVIDNQNVELEKQRAEIEKQSKEMRDQFAQEEEILEDLRKEQYANVIERLFEEPVEKLKKSSNITTVLVAAVTVIVGVLVNIAVAFGGVYLDPTQEALEKKIEDVERRIDVILSSTNQNISQLVVLDSTLRDVSQTLVERTEHFPKLADQFQESFEPIKDYIEREQISRYAERIKSRYGDFKTLADIERGYKITISDFCPVSYQRYRLAFQHASGIVIDKSDLADWDAELSALYANWLQNTDGKSGPIDDGWDLQYGNFTREIEEKTLYDKLSIGIRTYEELRQHIGKKMSDLEEQRRMNGID